MTLLPLTLDQPMRPTRSYSAGAALVQGASQLLGVPAAFLIQSLGRIG